MNDKKFLIVAALTVAMLSGGPFVADNVIVVPSGWELDLSKSPHSISPTGVAVVIYKMNATPPPHYESTKVLQIVNGAIFSETEFSGTVFRVEYSSNGQFLLVHEHDPNQPWPKGSRHLVRPNGFIQWTKQDSRRFRFSPSGDAVFAVQDKLAIGYGKKLEVFDIMGNSLSTAEFDRVMKGAAVLQGGDITVVAVGHSLLARDMTASPPTQLWQTDLGAYDTDIGGLTATSESRLIVDQDFGRFLVVDASNGSVLHRYNAEYLGEIDPNLTMADYGGYAPFAGSDRRFPRAL